MVIKDRIMDNKINFILSLMPKTKMTYGIRFDNNKVIRFSHSKHLSKSGRQYALFMRVYLGKNRK